ncbi:hypothetical protein L228DRAFT_250628 [Xylona heveae TC161]|uniref:Cora-domain-containing protein n=1 Tax=Xylona heveae (strain CBS 132557 / TC161) TaxID=1328760 RepID=A0A164ZVI4_XYLHT|nr:hypothetical protein L228DRAFT_250628 [Xylona heveae TC161]KZF19587.1 hypothetical protein L228DRAFT_250628 [Xylona heveae TC161]
MAIKEKTGTEPYWKRKRLTPDKLQIEDIVLREPSPGRPALLEVHEQVDLQLDTHQLAREEEKERVHARDWPDRTPLEISRLEMLRKEYGWMKHLRVTEPKDNWKCRWIHISSTLPEYLAGVLAALSEDQRLAIQRLSMLDQTIFQNEKFSRHGKYFSPFFKPLNVPSDVEDDPATPLLLCVPFMDWSDVTSDARIPRFQVDPLENIQSVKASSHPVRSILQHYYRLEDTTDRERKQVFSRSQPWAKDHLMTARVGRWYGRKDRDFYPTGLVVDEMWILLIDPGHIVSFSTNQSWKPRMIPHQLSTRIREVSFKTVRNNFSLSKQQDTYDALTHMVTCMHGAFGLLHWSFWQDFLLCLTDRFAQYLNHLQFRLYRAPSSKLVMDILQIQDELNIILKLMHSQRRLCTDLQSYLSTSYSHLSRSSTASRLSQTYPVSGSIIHAAHLRNLDSRTSSLNSRNNSLASHPPTHGTDSLPATSSPAAAYIPSTPDPVPAAASVPPTPSCPSTPIHTHGHIYTPFDSNPLPHAHTALTNPIIHLTELLDRELADLADLRESSGQLVNRTIQLVNMRQEDHGKAILVFTVVTLIFLPLSFVTSYFGMNTSDIRDMAAGQGIFWAVAGTVTLLVVASSLFVAFYGVKVWERFLVSRHEGKGDSRAGLGDLVEGRSVSWAIGVPTSTAATTTAARPGALPVAKDAARFQSPASGAGTLGVGGETPVGGLNAILRDEGGGSEAQEAAERGQVFAGGIGEKMPRVKWRGTL